MDDALQPRCSYNRQTEAMVEEKNPRALAFLHGLTGAGLFHRLDYPGAPTEFIDSRSYEEFAESLRERRSESLEHIDTNLA
jgi:hypothetical protein